VEPFKRKHPEFAKVKTPADKPAKERVEVTPDDGKPSGGGERLQIPANAAGSGDAQE
jgi:hypothetical protein